LNEYERIKDEQKSRIGFRDNLIYATLASMALVVGAALQGNGNSAMLVLMPPVALLLGWTYVVNDEKISAIGRYVRTDLGPRLAELVEGLDEPFGWETAHRSDRRRLSRKYLQLLIDLLLFCVAPAAALLAYWSVGPVHAPVLARRARARPRCDRRRGCDGRARRPRVPDRPLCGPAERAVPGSPGRRIPGGPE